MYFIGGYILLEDKFVCYIKGVLDDINVIFKVFLIVVNKLCDCKIILFYIVYKYI